MALFSDSFCLGEYTWHGVHFASSCWHNENIDFHTGNVGFHPWDFADSDGSRRIGGQVGAAADVAGQVRLLSLGLRSTVRGI